jgi:predicted nucleic acid-binding protein
MNGVDYLTDTNILIAATAMQQGLTLVTADKGFNKIANLDLLLINC